MAEAKRVFVVSSYHPEYQWERDYLRALSARLSSRCQLAFYNLDSKRLPADQVEKRAQTALERVRAFHPDLVIVGDDAALKMVGTALAPSGLPVIFLGINNNPRNYFPGGMPGNVSGVLERPLLLRNLFELGHAVPGTRRALALFDTDLTSAVIRDETFLGHDSIRVGDIDVDMAMLGSFADWKKQVLAAPGHYQVIWVGLYFTLRDDKGRVVDGEDVVRWTAQNAKLPLFAFWDFAVGRDKAAGGLVLTGREQGEEAAKMAEAVLFKGQALAGIFPLVPSQGQFLFSRSALQRYRVRLPARIENKASWLE
ncbi:ABC transporter substrate-binding protein [Chromobacterium sp. IIBBL 290-4]|uniref:ABC transporter substrate-binding protein n=1 Tax=Chromobacterium sp. IIBBL 290-4 TaxID=2953890 RepID=UPI0020B834DB|nr:hypothetical protein [Chromobacterium sp. IIBBL 290-4]UTH76325.1 hypothetical protein NKT35_09560 [Chromobacterium sp. IIBBL 290-4]